MEINWLQGVGNIGTEMISPGGHITPNQWDTDWNLPFGESMYDYISDYDCIFPYPLDYDNLLENGQITEEARQGLQNAQQQGTSITINDLDHFTNNAKAAAIMESRGFKGGSKKINEEEGQDVVAKFSWWSIYHTQHDINMVRDHMQNTINPFLDENDQEHVADLRNQFASSTAFQRHTQYGNVYFKYSIDDLCSYYSESIASEELQYRVLGTYLYKQEIMHAVVVCDETAGNAIFNEYPHVLTPDDDPNNEAAVTRDLQGNWIWRPQATGTKITRLNRFFQSYPIYRRWEHVAFAFHLPSEDDILTVDDIDDHYHEQEIEH